MTREPITRETNSGPAANDLFQLRVPHGRTPEERRADFTKGLTDFLRTKPPADAPAMGDGVTRRGKTPEERRKNFPKMLRAFVSANCDAEGGS